MENIFVTTRGLARAVQDFLTTKVDKVLSKDSDLPVANSTVTDAVTHITAIFDTEEEMQIAIDQGLLKPGQLVATREKDEPTFEVATLEEIDNIFKKGV